MEVELTNDGPVTLLLIEDLPTVSARPSEAVAHFAARPKLDPIESARLRLYSAHF